MGRHRSSAVPLAWLYAALIVYASLYPFADWREASGPPLEFLNAPWPRWWTGFDLFSNFLGYLPLGALLCLAWLRGGGRTATAFAMSVGLAAALSVAMEMAQNFLPQRVPSNVDLALNVLGAAAGAALGLVAHLAGAVARWESWRSRWFIEGSAGASAPGAVGSGQLRFVTHEVTIKCPAASLPEFLTVDISHLQLSQSIHVNEMKLPEGATPVTPGSVVIVQVVAPSQSADDAAGAVAEPELIRKEKAAEGDAKPKS